MSRPEAAGRSPTGASGAGLPGATGPTRRRRSGVRADALPRRRPSPVAAVAGAERARASGDGAPAAGERPAEPPEWAPGTGCTDPPTSVPEARDAATVALLRPTPAGADDACQVLLLRRPRRLRAFGGAWVFPGGAVSPEDRLAEWAARLAPVSTAGLAARLARADVDADPVSMERYRRLRPDEWVRVPAAYFSAPASTPAADRAVWVTALRELFEETGVLLAHGVLPARRTLEEARRQLLSHRAGFREVVDRLGIRLDPLHLRYAGRLVTPPPWPRRFDTRFFVAWLPPGQRAAWRPAAAEVTAACWLAPAEALRRSAAGRLALVGPTRFVLDALSGERPSPIPPPEGGPVDAPVDVKPDGD